MTLTVHEALDVVELPRDATFSTLSKAILTRLINHQFQVLSYSQELRHRLTQLVLNNQGLSEILSVLAELLNRKVRLVDNSCRLLAKGGHPAMVRRILPRMWQKNFAGCGKTAPLLR
jgi:hypothetical protein